MTPNFVIAGKLTRDYLLPPQGNPILDSAGGNLLYATGGLAVWDSSIGLISRIGKDYPKAWLHDFEKRGFDIRGIETANEKIDLRNFIAYTDTQEKSQSSAVSHFARRELTFPKDLLGYQAPDDAIKDLRQIESTSPSALNVPKDYRDVKHVHICAFDFASQSQMVNLFKSASHQTVTLAPDSRYMIPRYWRELRLVLQGITAFLPSEEEMRALFWGETNDLWEMASQVAMYGPRFIVIKRGASGQYLYDALNKKRYEIPVYSSRVADPTGVGDAFCGGYLAGFAKTDDALQAVLYGNVSASLKIEGSGAFYPLEVMSGLAEARLFALKDMIREV